MDKEKSKKKLKLCGIGALSGLVNGLLGSGGGIVVVQMLESQGVDEKRAHATSLMAILPLTIISLFMYSNYGFVDWTSAIYVSIGALAGGFTGAVFLKNVKTGLLNNIFTLIIIASGVRLLF